jgi:hypothetical protein
MVGPAAGPLEQPPSANNANISPTASARTGALLLILITIVRIIGFMMLDPYSAPRLTARIQRHAERKRLLSRCAERPFERFRDFCCWCLLTSR